MHGFTRGIPWGVLSAENFGQVVSSMVVKGIGKKFYHGRKNDQRAGAADEVKIFDNGVALPLTTRNRYNRERGSHPPAQWRTIIAGRGGRLPLVGAVGAKPSRTPCGGFLIINLFDLG